MICLRLARDVVDVNCQQFVLGRIAFKNSNYCFDDLRRVRLSFSMGNEWSIQVAVHNSYSDLDRVGCDLDGVPGMASRRYDRLFDFNIGHSRRCLGVSQTDHPPPMPRRRPEMR